MKVTNKTHVNSNIELKKPSPKKNISSLPDVVVDIKKLQNISISKNNPQDPTVATKVLDSLNSGIINFSQQQRDAIAKVMARQANLVQKKSID